MSKKTLNELIAIQTTLGGLGFSISGDGSYYKEYGLLDGSVVRLVPHFDQGISLDNTYTLSAVSIQSVRTIPIEGNAGATLSAVPRECVEDMTAMLASMAPQSRVAPQESYIISEKCSSCDNEVSSFFRKDGEVLCLTCL